MKLITKGVKIFDCMRPSVYWRKLTTTKIFPENYNFDVGFMMVSLCYRPVNCFYGEFEARVQEAVKNGPVKQGISRGRRKKGPQKSDSSDDEVSSLENEEISKKAAATQPASRSGSQSESDGSVQNQSGDSDNEEEAQVTKKPASRPHQTLEKAATANRRLETNPPSKDNSTLTGEDEIALLGGDNMGSFDLDLMDTAENEKQGFNSLQSTPAKTHGTSEATTPTVDSPDRLMARLQREDVEEDACPSPSLNKETLDTGRNDELDKDSGDSARASATETSRPNATGNSGAQSAERVGLSGNRLSMPPGMRPISTQKENPAAGALQLPAASSDANPTVPAPAPNTQPPSATNANVSTSNITRNTPTAAVTRPPVTADADKLSAAQVRQLTCFLKFNITDDI